MSLIITDDCTNCDACEPECPNKAITMGDDIYEINPALCTECVGFFDTPQCADVCPVDCCEDDTKEEESVLLERAKTIHPDTNIPEDYPSRYK